MKKVPKYRNRKVERFGLKFDSEREADRYGFLLYHEKEGLIDDLEVHPRYELEPAVTETFVEHLKTKDRERTRTLQKPITYTADFRYVKDGETVVEDVKISPCLLPKEFVLKEKLMFARFGIRIRRVYKPLEPI